MKKTLTKKQLIDSNKKLRPVINKLFNNERISEKDALLLYTEADLSVLGVLADWKNESYNQNNVYFNRNIHIEPTNICIYNCLFCSYSRNIGAQGAWEHSLQKIINLIKQYTKQTAITEVHIVGGVHPRRDLSYYCRMLSEIKYAFPLLHLKAFTAVEIDYMIKKSKLTIEEGLKRLKKAGLDSMPGGGAEIFDEEVRKEICPDKTSSEQWLKIHKTAHQLDIPTNATMLYGHIETYENRIDHLSRLRKLQDETNGFNTFIPLKYRHIDNQLEYIGEVSITEDLKNYAVSRLFLDNFKHLKAYWPMIGKEESALALSFGVDDIDGTIEDTTKIYTMSGVKHSKNAMTVADLVKMIKRVSKIPVERDTLYNKIKTYQTEGK